MPSKSLPRKRIRRSRGVMSLTSWRGLARNRVVYWFLAIVMGVGIVAMFSGIGGRPQGSSGESQEARSGEVILTVNGEPVKRGEYETMWQMMRQQQNVTELESAMPQGCVTQELIKRALVRSLAKARGIKVSDAEVDR
jgi:hypothetical protein